MSLADKRANLQSGTFCWSVGYHCVTHRIPPRGLFSDVWERFSEECAQLRAADDGAAAATVDESCFARAGRPGRQYEWPSAVA